VPPAGTADQHGNYREGSTWGNNHSTYSSTLPTSNNGKPLEQDAVPIPWRCLVPALAAGPIVGKAGDNLKRYILQIEDPYARIDVTKDGELQNLEDKMLIIRASNAEKKTDMVRYVLQKVDQTLYGPNAPEVEKKWFCLCIPQMVLGAVLGNRGENVRAILHETALDKIDIPKSPSFGTDFVVRLVGETEPILKATTMIYQIVQDVARENRLSERDLTVKPKMYSNLQLVKAAEMMPNFLNTQLSALQVTGNVRFLVSKNEASWMIGRNGNVILDLRKNSGATFEVKELENYNQSRLVEVGGVYQFKLAGVELMVKCLETCQQRTNSVTILIPAPVFTAKIGTTVLTEIQKASGVQKIEAALLPSTLRFASTVRNPNWGYYQNGEFYTVRIEQKNAENPLAPREPGYNGPSKDYVYAETINENGHATNTHLPLAAGVYDSLRIATQMLVQKLEEATMKPKIHIALHPKCPEQNSLIRLLIMRDEVGWIIGKGGRVMKDVRRTSGATTWIKDDFFPLSIGEYGAYEFLKVNSEGKLEPDQFPSNSPKSPACLADRKGTTSDGNGIGNGSPYEEEGAVLTQLVGGPGKTQSEESAALQGSKAYNSRREMLVSALGASAARHAKIVPQTGSIYPPVAPPPMDKQPTLPHEQTKVIEVCGRLEATLSCLELMLLVNEKFGNKQSCICLLCPIEHVHRVDLERVRKCCPSQVPKITLSSQKIFCTTYATSAGTSQSWHHTSNGWGGMMSPEELEFPMNNPSAGASSPMSPSNGEKTPYTNVYAVIQVEGHNDAGRRAAMLVSMLLAEVLPRDWQVTVPPPQNAGYPNPSGYTPMNAGAAGNTSSSRGGSVSWPQPSPTGGNGGGQTVGGSQGMTAVGASGSAAELQLPAASRDLPGDAGSSSAASSAAASSYGGGTNVVSTGLSSSSSAGAGVEAGLGTSSAAGSSSSAAASSSSSREEAGGVGGSGSQGNASGASSSGSGSANPAAVSGSTTGAAGTSPAPAAGSASKTTGPTGDSLKKSKTTGDNGSEPSEPASGARKTGSSAAGTSS